MKNKRLLSVGLAVLLAATMPLNVQAFDEIEIGTSEMNFDDVEISEELESSSEDIESKDDEADVEAEADIEENNIESEDDIFDDSDLFSSEETEAVSVGDEITPEIKIYNDLTTLVNSKIDRENDNVLNLRCMITTNVSDIRKVDEIVIKADVYIDDNKINGEPIVLEKSAAKQAKGTYTLKKEVLEEYTEGKLVTVKYYSDFDTESVKTNYKKSFAIPALSNPTVTEIIQRWRDFSFERGEECRGTIDVKLSGAPVGDKSPYYAIYINGERKTEPVALDKSSVIGAENAYKKEISIAPELTEYLPEGTKIQIKVGFGSEMEDVSDEKILEIEATGKPFIQGAKVDEIRSYKDAEYEKSLGFVRAGRDYTAYLKGTFRDVIETEPLEVYAGVYVNNSLVGELQPMTVESDNSAYSGKITFSLPENTPASTAGRVVSIKVGIGKDMDNCAAIGKVSREKFDLQAVKTSKVEILDYYQENEVKQIDRNAPQGFVVNLKFEGIPGDFYDMHSEICLGEQVLKKSIGSTSGFRVGFSEEEIQKIKDYEGSSLTVKLINDEDDVALFSYDMPLVGLTTKEEETANTVADQLKNLPAVDKITLEDKESVKAARDAYDALNEDQKKLVPEEQVKVLTDAETKITELQKAADKKAADEKAAKAVTDKIASLPVVKNLKLTDASKVKAARDVYNKLSADQKKLVTAAQLKVLTDAEARIAQLQKAAQVKPKITLNVTSLPIQVKKSTTGVRIKTTAIKGDKIKSAKSSNSKVAKVSVKNGKLTIKGLKAGKATVTVTSTKGAKATVKIKVQKQKVATKKLKATVSTKQILKKGKKVKLKVAKTPFTAQDTVKWTSSNKKIATVTSKGVVKGLKKGTATITAKAGKKVVRFKITVK